MLREVRVIAISISRLFFFFLNLLVNTRIINDNLRLTVLISFWYGCVSQCSNKFSQLFNLGVLFIHSIYKYLLHFVDGAFDESFLLRESVSKQMSITTQVLVKSVTVMKSHRQSTDATTKFAIFDTEHIVACIITEQLFDRLLFGVCNFFYHFLIKK